MHVRDKLFIGGAWVASTGSGTIDVVNSATEEVIGTIPEGTPEDVDRAVRAAPDAFPAWSEPSADERGKILARVQEGLTARTDDIATLISQEVGMPFTLSNLIQVGLPVMSFSTAAQLATEFPFEEEAGSSLIVREPVGVVGAITPWNYPLHQIAAKVAPALAAGCTVVLKPSEVAPLNAFILAEIFDDIGLPPGVFNLVTGLGPVVGEAIASHPLVDMVSFTGSTRAGKRVMELASAERQAGGPRARAASRPTCILEDADLDRRCPPAWPPLHELGPDLLGAHPHARAPVAPGRGRGTGREDGRDLHHRATPSTPPPASAPSSRHPARAGAGLHPEGRDEGAKLLTGGAEAPEGLDKGYFVRPTVFSNVTRDMTIAQEEIFGPVLSIIPYDTEEEAIDIANDTVYGLAGGGVGGGQGARRACGPQAPDGPGRGERGRLQPPRALRRLQAVGHRARARQVRAGGVPGDQGPPALRLPPCPAARRGGASGAGRTGASEAPSPIITCDDGGRRHRLV